MRQYIPVITLAAALALLVGVLLPSDNLVFAADPEFASSSDTRSVPENTPPGTNIGEPVAATDDDESALEFGDTLTYSLEGDDAASFDIDSSTGQLITKAPLDTEADSSHSVTVRVKDSDGNEDDIAVTISVTNVNEPPAAPAAPTVVSGKDTDTSDEDEQSTERLHVVWHAPENTGPRTLTYQVEFKKSTETDFGITGVTPNAAQRTATITGLEADNSYDVRVRATNGENDSHVNWSFVGTGSTNKEGNSPPQSNDETIATRNVDENTPAGENIGSPVSASDLDTTTLTYTLGGPDAGLFNFTTRTGQLRTKAPLNHEDPRCYDASTPSDTKCYYYVTVTVVDGAGGSDATGVRIEVGDRTEPASAPARPTIRATEKSSTSLDVSWSAPQNAGPDIVSYEVQWRKGSDPFSTDGVAITGTTATISGVDNTNDDTPWLEPNTTYEVRVRADNGERMSAWSASGSGRTSRGNHDPIFDDRPGGSERGNPLTVWRTIDENPRSGQVVGRLFADDEDNDRLTYKLNGANAGMFDFNESNGEIRTKAGVDYNYEAINAATCAPLTADDVGTDRCYEVTVEVRDGLEDNRAEVEETDPDDSITVKIGVRDREEPPSVPTVTVTSPEVNTTLVVVWEAENTGPEITGFDVQYRKGSGSFSDDNCVTSGTGNCSDITTTMTTITGLEEDTSYSVQVRAKNDEGTSAWSRLETLKTNKGTNQPPTFEDSRDPIPLQVNENTPANRDIDTVVVNEDVSTSLTYELDGRDASLFSIVSPGQIRTRSALNTEAICSATDADLNGGHQENCTYNVRVRVDDRAGGSAYRAVTIMVSDVDEPPAAPSAPRVTATKDTGWSLDVTWTAPRNTGKPPITDYDVEYRKVKSGTPDNWELWPHGTEGDPRANSTETSAKITRRLPADTEDPLEPPHPVRGARKGKERGK